MASKQNGAVLFVGLMLLLLLTIMGVAAFEGTASQTHMARNSLFSVQTYHVALSEINAQIDELDKNLLPLMQAIESGAPTEPAPLMQSAHHTQRVRYEFIGSGIPPTGYSIDSYIGLRFDLNSEAVLADTGVLSDQTQGLNYAGPK